MIYLAFNLEVTSWCYLFIFNFLLFEWCGSTKWKWRNTIKQGRLCQFCLRINPPIYIHKVLTTVCVMILSPQGLCRGLLFNCLACILCWSRHYYLISLYLETPYTSLECVRSNNMSLESIILQLGMYNNIFKQFISTTILLLSAPLHQKTALIITIMQMMINMQE